MLCDMRTPPEEEEEMEDENPDGEVGYQDDNRNIEFELPEECYE